MTTRRWRSDIHEPSRRPPHGPGYMLKAAAKRATVCPSTEDQGLTNFHGPSPKTQSGHWGSALPFSCQRGRGRKEGPPLCGAPGLRIQFIEHR
jgi:hypothetical protein